MALEKSGNGFSAFDGDNVIACAGIVVFWEGRAQVWAIMSRYIGCYAFTVHRAVKRYLRAYRCARLECIIDPTFTRSVEWARRLGFSFESVMPKYGMGGDTMHMFVRLE